jgi:hypothetical protein
MTLVALVAAGVALAGNPGKEKVALTAAGNAKAKAEVLHKADVGSDLKGGFRKPQIPPSLNCPTYRPKQSDLVLVGAAESVWKNQLLAVESAAQVLRTSAMVRLDWQRTVLARQVMPCMAQNFSKSLGSNAALVSFRHVSFPHLATYTRAFRVVAKVSTPGGVVPAEIDLVALASGRNELTLTVTGPGAAKTFLRAQEVGLARALARRVRP